MDVITLASRKGGAGKSTLTAQLAAQAKAQGRRALVIDAEVHAVLAAQLARARAIVTERRAELEAVATKQE